MPEMRWKCDKDGCFNEKKRLKLGIFDDCFPGRIAFGDVDAIVEISGNFLLMEWKDAGCGDVSGGQRYMYEAMTRDEKFLVIAVYGDAEIMEIQSIQIYHNGKATPREPCTIEELKMRVKRWAKKQRKF